MLIRRSGTQVIGERQAPSLPGEIELARASDFEIGPLQVEPSTLQVRFGGASRTIEPRVMQVLVLLANERGSVVSRDRMIDCCWGGRVVSEDAINRPIAKVRRLGTESGAFELETIPRVGYRLLAGGDPAAAPPKISSGGLAAMALALIACVVAGLWYWNSSPAAVPEPKVAVVPFLALNPDSETRDVAQSVAATVSSALVQTGARLPDNIASLDDARRSGTAIIVSGTVRRDGSSVDVTVRVDSAHAGSSLLTNEFKGAADQTAALAGQVASWLVPPVRMWSSFLPVERDPAVTDEIMRIFLTRSAGQLLRAWELADSLATAKPRSGPAQLVLALLTSDVLSLIAPDQRLAAVQKARQAAIDASRLLPDPARPLAVLDCHLKAPGWHVLTAECDRRNRAAISSNPHVPLLPFLFAAQLADAGRFRDAERFADMDLAQSPLGPGQLGLRIFVGRMAHGGGADDELPQLEDRVHRYVGAHALDYFDFKVAVANGDIAAAESLLRDNSEATAHGHPWDGASPIADEQGRATIELVLRALRSKSPGDLRAMQSACDPPADALPDDPAFGTCLIGLTLLGDLEHGFALAKRGYRDVECCSPAQQEQQWIATGGDYYPLAELFGKAMAPMRGDPRFIEIARRTGLLAYWKSGHAPDFCSFEQAPVCQLLK
jgi:TolB-like protein